MMTVKEAKSALDLAVTKRTEADRAVEDAIFAWNKADMENRAVKDGNITKVTLQITLSGPGMRLLALSMNDPVNFGKQLSNSLCDVLRDWASVIPVSNDMAVLLVDQSVADTPAESE